MAAQLREVLLPAGASGGGPTSPRSTAAGRPAAGGSGQQPLRTGPCPQRGPRHRRLPAPSRTRPHEHPGGSLQGNWSGLGRSGRLGALKLRSPHPPGGREGPTDDARSEPCAQLIHPGGGPNTMRGPRGGGRVRQAGGCNVIGTVTPESRRVGQTKCVARRRQGTGQTRFFLSAWKTTSLSIFVGSVGRPDECLRVGEDKCRSKSACSTPLAFEGATAKGRNLLRTTSASSVRVDEVMNNSGGAVVIANARVRRAGRLKLQGDRLLRGAHHGRPVPSRPLRQPEPALGGVGSGPGWSRRGQEFVYLLRSHA